MPLRRMLEGMTFSPEDIAIMTDAYDVVRRELDDRGQPEIVNEVLAKRIIALGGTKALNAEEMATRALTSFGFVRR